MNGKSSQHVPAFRPFITALFVVMVLLNDIETWRSSVLAQEKRSESTNSGAPQWKDVEELDQWAWSKEEVAEAGTNFWPQFRGPSGDGRARDAQPPTEWSETKNIQWKTAIHGQGWCSPVVWKDQIWLTTAKEDGTAMSVLCVDVQSGKILIDRLLWDHVQPQKDHHVTNSYASPSPVIDGERVYVHFGAYGTAALDAKSGDTIWERRDLPCNHFRGPGSSPILFGNLLIFHMDGYDFKYIVALDKRTGKTVWKVDRDVDYGSDDGDIHKAYSTPTLIQTKYGVQMVCPTAKAMVAYSPLDGKTLWRVRYDEYSTSSRAIFDGTFVYMNTGFMKSRLIAVRPAEGGDITASNIAWETNRGIPQKPSMTFHGDWVFSVDDRGIVGCHRRSDGEQVWQERVGGDFSASPTIADGKLYLFDHDGKGYVFLADGSKTLVAQNTLDSGCRASPAAVGKRLIVRTVSHLYSIGE